MSAPLSWPPGADDVIRARYTRVTGHKGKGLTARLATDLGVKPHNIRQRAKQLGLTGKRQGRDWTEREVEILRLVVSRGATLPTIAEATGRTHGSVVNKAKDLRISRPKARRHGGERGWRGVLTLEQVRAAFQTGSIPPAKPEPEENRARPGRMWTRAETDYLIEHVGTMPLGRLASNLGRSVRAIEHKCHHLGCHPTFNSEGLLIPEVRERTNASDIMIYRALKAGLLSARRAHTRKRTLWVFSEGSVEAWREQLQAQGWETDRERADTIRERWLTAERLARQAGVGVDRVYKEARAGDLEWRRLSVPDGGSARFFNPAGSACLRTRRPPPQLQRVLRARSLITRLEPHVPERVVSALRALPASQAITAILGTPLAQFVQEERAA